MHPDFALMLTPIDRYHHNRIALGKKLRFGCDDECRPDMTKKYSALLTLQPEVNGG